MQPQQINELCDIIRETSFSIHRYHRSGHLEKIYLNALIHRLGLKGLDVKSQLPLTVKDEDGFLLGEFCADLLVEKVLIVEIKACSTIVNEHIAQLLGYLRSSGLEHGLLINFGAPRLQIKKYVLSRGDVEKELNLS